jgi:hypothetical protein
VTLIPLVPAALCCHDGLYETQFLPYRRQQPEDEPKVPKQFDEQPDLTLVADWLGTHGLTTERFSQRETQTGKTPDFRVKRGDHLLAYCEVKSPNDPWLDEQLEHAPAFTLVGGPRRDSTFNRLARLINKAAEQFTAVNQDRSALNVLAYVNHVDASGFHDLQEVLTGHIRAADGMLIQRCCISRTALSALRNR